MDQNEMDLGLSLNPEINQEAARTAYENNGIVQIHNFLTPQSAQALYNLLTTNTPWWLALSQDDGSAGLLSPNALSSMDPKNIRELKLKAQLRAAHGFGYIYSSYPLVEARDMGWDQGHSLHTLLSFLNQADVLSLFRSISQAQGRSLDAQASLFRPGDFLNLHDDKDKGQRICAYTLGLSAHWRPDWGGQLLFHDERDDIKLGLMPRFNTLSVFKVPVRHSVAMVASYARAPRLSITGWFLD